MITGSATAAAYQRGDLLALRAGLMDQWARYLTGEPEG